tara:strand:+ start:397 stop:2334 length:1938 start_codon:yes stop_codon:yes gene_type:complete
MDIPDLQQFEKLSKKYSVIPLKGKAPIEKDWTKWCSKKRPFDRKHFKNKNAGIATGTASNSLVLDIDDKDLFDKYMHENDLSLPETFQVESGNGGMHFYFKYPQSGKVYGNRSCKKHGFDVKGTGGQVVAPGSIHPKTKRPYCIVRDIPIVDPPEFLKTLAATRIEATSQPHVEGIQWDGDLDSLPIRQETKDLIRNGRANGERSEAMMTVLNALAGAGLADDQIISIFDTHQIGEKYRENGDSRKKWIAPQIAKARSYVNPMPAIISPQEGPTDLAFPKWVISGVAGEFSGLYSEALEPPQEFFYFAFLTCLGNVLADKLTLSLEITPQPRLYTVLIGESADDRKSTAADKTISFFGETFLEEFNVCHGVGSAEGLQKRLEKAEHSKILLFMDELKQFVSKCKIDSSVLLPCVNTLFESNRYESQTKNSSINIEKGHLSVLACTTKATFDAMWTSAFTDIGFNNRIFLVPAKGKRQYALPQQIPEKYKNQLKKSLKSISLINEKLFMVLTSDAEKLYEEWYLNLEQSVHSKRIDAYALRLMPLLAINDKKNVVDEETVRKAIAIANWQLEVRKELDPVDADNVVAKLEEKIRRQLRKGTMKKYHLKQKTNANKTGLWYFDTALRNLLKDEIYFDSKTKLFSLKP